MARQRKMTLVRRVFINSLLEHYKPSDANDVQEISNSSISMYRYLMETIIDAILFNGLLPQEIIIGQLLMNPLLSKFRSDRYQFTVVLPNLNYGVDEHNVEFINDTKEISGANDAKVGANDANMENQMNILIKKIIENPQITQNKLASELGVSRRTVQRMIEKFVSDAKIIRVGSKRSGYWQVVK